MYYRHYLEVRYIVGFMIDSDRLSCLLSRKMSAIERPFGQFPLSRHNGNCPTGRSMALIVLDSRHDNLSESTIKPTIYRTSRCTSGFSWTMICYKFRPRYNIVMDGKIMISPQATYISDSPRPPPRQC